MEQGQPEAVALENAARKARTVAAQRPDALVLGVDTVVALGERLYGKPADRAQADATLRALAGREHQVVTGMCLIDPEGGERQATCSTAVLLQPLNEEILSWYLDGGEWRERAGGYAIQGRGAALVGAIDGDYLNVVGLPVKPLLALEPRLLKG